MALTLHKKEVESISFDKSGEYCVTTSRDGTFIVYYLDDNYKNAKLVVSKESEILQLYSRSAIVVANIPHRKPVLVIAVTNGEIIELYQGEPV